MIYICRYGVNGTWYNVPTGNSKQAVTEGRTSVAKGGMEERRHPFRSAIVASSRDYYYLFQMDLPFTFSFRQIVGGVTTMLCPFCVTTGVPPLRSSFAPQTCVLHMLLLTKFLLLPFNVMFF